MSKTQEPHILIVGAGITGLIIAHGLQQAGIKFTIFESEEAGRWRPKEWTMGIHWGLPLLETLLPPHLAARIPKDGSVDGFLNYDEPPNNGAYIFDGLTGEILKDLTVTGRIVRVSRRKLRALCSEDVEVKHSHTLQNVTCNDEDNTVNATFTNGQSYTGTLLVGCDGPRSVVRSYLFAADPASAQAKVLDEAVNIRRSRPRAAGNMAILSYDQLAWGRDDNLSHEGRLQAIKDRGAGLAERMDKVALANQQQSLSLFGLHSYQYLRIRRLPYTDISVWVAEPWDTHDGRVTLAGDSAHPMPPFRGQGGNHAIQDAYNFVEAVKQIAGTTDGRSQLQTKLMKDYSDEVAKRGAEETILSMKNGKFLMAYHDFKESPYMKQGLNRGGSK